MRNAEVKDVRTPNEGGSGQLASRTLAGSSILYWAAAVVLVVGLLVGVPLGIAAAAGVGVDPTLLCTAVVGLGGAAIVLVVLTRPRVLGRAVASQAQFMSLGLSLVIGGAVLALTGSVTVLIIMFAVGVVAFRLLGRSSRQ